MKLPGLLLAAVLSSWCVAADDVLVDDFEREAYDGWVAEGTAFGAGPARGTLPGQMEVSGHRGERLVNSFHGGDASTGRLTSRPFTLERDHLAFLIGGGGHEGTALRLKVDGQVVRSASGPNTSAGGSEALEPAGWDVRPWRGKTAVLEIIDEETGGWGHINVDHIVQTDAAPPLSDLQPREREFAISEPYLIIPIRNGARPTELVLEIEGRPVRRYSTELAPDPAQADWHAYFHLGGHEGKKAVVRASRAGEAAFAAVRQAREVPGADTRYSEKLRPQFHFSQDVGWNNDPNGMVYLDGEWHLFFQHNPVGWKWGNMTWGHAVSRDLLHWEQLPPALFPKTMLKGDTFSGGATVDVKDTAGWKTGELPPLVAFFTDTGAGESVAFSNDRGRTFTLYEGNPVVRHKGRDPKVIWYAYGEDDAPLNEEARRLGGHWVMAVYNEDEGVEKNITFLTSTNLKQWERQSRLDGFFECPELFRLPVEGTAEHRWVTFGADARYVLGEFDGRRFTPAHEGKHRVHYGNYYAAQTFENAPGGRRVQIGWAQIAMPGMPFNQTFSFPHEMTLRQTEEGVRLFARPIPEISRLHQRSHRLEDRPLQESPSLPVSGELFDIRATFEVGEAAQLGLELGGERIVYDVAARQLGEAPLSPVDGQLTLQVLLDRPMIEICGNDGRIFVTAPRREPGPLTEVRAFGDGGRLLSLEVHELKSIWPQRGR